MKLFISNILLIIFLSGCASDPDVYTSDVYADRLPRFEFNQFFQGQLCAKGLVRSRDGLVNRKFIANIEATSSEDSVVLDEIFLFDDGEKQTRLWQFNRIGNSTTEDNGWTGIAGDVVGQAVAKTIGDSFNLTYQLKIQVDSEEYIIAMDDWLHQIDNTTLIGSTDMSKWGFNVGRIDIVIEKKTNLNNPSLIQNEVRNVNSCINANNTTNQTNSIKLINPTDEANI